MRFWVRNGSLPNILYVPLLHLTPPSFAIFTNTKHHCTLYIQMPMSSISLLRLKTPPFYSLRRHFFSISAAARQNPSNTSRKLPHPHHQQQQPSKHLLKARDTVKKHFSILAPVLSQDEKLQLLNNQAVGLVAASQANFMRVVIQSPPPQPSGSQIHGNRDDFVKIQASRSSREVSAVQFSQTKASGSQISCDGNRDEFVNIEGSRSFGERLSGNPDEFLKVEASRSSADLSGVRFSQSEASRNRDEFVKLEGSRSFGEVSGVRFSQSEAPFEKLEESLGGGIEAKQGGVELLCVVKAVLKKIKRRVLVGDKVLVSSIDWVDRRGMIENVFERKSEVLDPPVANVDHLVVLFSMDQPKIEPFALTRFLVEAESTGIPFFLALNKSELVDEETLSEWKVRLRKWGYNPVFCSIESKRGLDCLQFILREQTSVIVGPSGVGKSSLINALRGNNPVLGVQQDDNWFDHILGSKWLEDQRVGEISMRSGRGKHTTRHVSLLPLTGGGYLADTPGFNQPSLIKVTKQSLAHHFPEIRKMLEESEPKKCAFNNCLHIGEPGCIVKGDWERYSYYLQLLDEIRIREEFQLRTVGTKREGDVRYKTGELGVVQAEPRLEPKKHRRVSRKKANQSIIDDLDEYDDDDEKDLMDENPVIRAVREEEL